MESVVLRPEGVVAYVEWEKTAKSSDLPHLSEKISRDFVRLEPEAVECYRELGDKRAKAPKLSDQIFMQTSQAPQITVRRLPTLAASPTICTFPDFLATGAGR